MGTKVKVGSPCSLSYMGNRYEGVIKEIRGSSKMFLVSFSKNGKTHEIWRSARELGPATQDQKDAEPAKIKIL